jgi:hypothetical protein
VVPRHHDLHRIRQLAREAMELLEGVNDGRVHRPDSMEDVAGNDDDVRPQFEHAIDRGTKRKGDIRLTLVDPSGRQPVILPVAKMKIRKVYEAHASI